MARVAIVLALAAYFILCMAASPPGKNGGKVTDPDGDCKISFSDGKLNIMVPGTAHDLSAELQSKRNAPRVMRDIKGDFIAEVRVDGSFNPAVESTVPGRT